LAFYIEKWIPNGRVKSREKGKKERGKKKDKHTQHPTQRGHYGSSETHGVVGCHIFHPIFSFT
jgi:hypothetical protein